MTTQPVPERRARRVTFRTAARDGVARVDLVGQFNEWVAQPMQRDGEWFAATVEIAPGTYRYKFLVDGEHWENDVQADDYAPNEFGGADSVVHVAPDDAPELPAGPRSGAMAEADVANGEGPA